MEDNFVEKAMFSYLIYSHQLTEKKEKLQVHVI